MSRIRVRPLALGPRLSGEPTLSGFFALGSLLAHARAFRGGELAERFDLGRVTPLDLAGLRAVAADVRADAPTVYLFSSYVWNHETNVEVARQLRRLDAGALFVVGGPHPPRQEEGARAFLEASPMFDVVARAEGERTLVDLLAALADRPEDIRRADLGAVAGISFRTAEGRVVRTPDRPRLRDLAQLPSPYTGGEFDHWLERLDYMPLETNRGCPYGCSFCDWGAATLSKVHLMSLERVLAEIEFAARHRVPLIGFCDANFGILPRDVEIARHVVRMHEKYGHPKEVGYTNAKVARPWLLEIYKILRDAGLIRFAQISMQTTDESVLENVDRANIKTEQYERMIAFFHAEDIPVASDTMIGLPGQTLGTLRTDLQFFFDRMVLPVFFATRVMPNAPMGSDAYRRKFGMTVDASGFVESSASFTREDYWRMFELCLTYKLFVQAGILKYLLYFMQVERGVPALSLVSAWLDELATTPRRHPASAAVREALLGRDWEGGGRDSLVLHWRDEDGALLLDDPDPFYEEILRLYEERLGAVCTGDDLASVMAVQRAVLPRKGEPISELELSHDVVGWFRELARRPRLRAGKSEALPLARRGPGRLRFPDRPRCTSYAFVDAGFGSGATLEARSSLSPGAGGDELRV